MHKYFDLPFLGSLAKIILAMTIMLLSVAFFIGSINQAAAADLKSSVTVTEDNITLGDVYTGIEKNASFVLAPSPEPGVSLVWDARTLNRLAKAFDLPSVSSTTQVTIRRIATIVTPDMVKKAVLDSLADKGAKGAFEVEFINEREARIILPQDMDPSVTVTQSSYNASRRTFSATLETPDNTTRQVTGMLHPLIEIPVLKTGARRGDTIGRNDVTTIAVREDFITDQMVIRPENLIGMTPKRIVRGNSPVAVSDLEKPLMVKRGELVTMELQRGPIQLSALAKALESGTSGDTIRLMNIDSKRTIEGEITGLRSARVTF